MRQFFRYAGICIGGVLLLVILYIFVPVLLNNIHAQFVGRKLNDIHHPSESRLLKRVLAVANLGAASNQCDYVAGEFRATKLSKKEVEDFYAPLVNSTLSLTATLTYEIYFADAVDGYQYLGIYTDLLRTYEQKPPSGERVYLFLIVDAYPPGLDYRCH